MSAVPSDPNLPSVAEVLAAIPRSRFLLTSAFGDLRRGLVVEWVQQCGRQPPVVMVALPKGQPISPVIRDSRRFAISSIRPGDLLLEKLFAPGAAGDGDPFLGLPLESSSLGLPLLARVEGSLECEMIRHLDIESDCELYIGLVRRAARPDAASRGRGSRATHREEPRAGRKAIDATPDPRRPRIRRTP